MEGVSKSNGPHGDGFPLSLLQPYHSLFVLKKSNRRSSEAASEASGARSAPAEPCDVYYSFLTQKESDMVGEVKEETRLHVAHYSCCGGLRRSVPKAVVGAPSPTSLRCHPGRGVPLKGLSSTKGSLSTRRAQFSSTHAVDSWLFVLPSLRVAHSSEVSELRTQCKKGSVRSLPRVKEWEKMKVVLFISFQSFFFFDSLLYIFFHFPD